MRKEDRMADVAAAKLFIPVETDANKATTSLGKLDGNLKKTDKGLKKVDNSSKQAKSSLDKVSKSFTNLGAVIPFAGIAGLLGLFKKIIDVTAQQQKAEAQLNAVLKSTGQAAGLTADQLKSMASGLQEVTTFGDEAIIQAQSLLLTFTKIGGDVFPQATETILNMAEAMGTDLKTQAIQVGKALNDPILGVTALRRVGVQLNDQQTELIKTFVETGQTAKAQAVILKELETQFGGVARASRQTLGGALKALSNTVGDALEGIGNKFTPALVDLAVALEDAFNKGGALAKIFDLIAFSITKTIQLISVLVKTFNLLSAVVKGIANIRAEGAFDDTRKALSSLKDTAADLVGIGQETQTQNENTAKSYRKTGQAARQAANATKEAIATQAKALEILEKAGDPTAFLERQRAAFEEQKRIVAKAGLDITTLEKFQQSQRQTQFDNFFKKIASNQQLSFDQRKTQLQQTLQAIQDAENLSNQERLAAQQAYNQQSALLEQQRFQAIANSVQFGAQVLGDFNQIAQSLAQVRRNQIEGEIQSLEDQGASEEEIAKKRAELQRKAAIDQKRFATISAILDTATAVTKALATVPPPASYALAALSAAKGAAQIAVIRSQPIPKAQFGGTFEVPPGNEADSGLIRVNQGERVQVTPAEQSGSQQEKRQTLMIGAQEFEGFLVDSMQRILNSGKVNINRTGVVRTA